MTTVLRGQAGVDEIASRLILHEHRASERRSWLRDLEEQWHQRAVADGNDTPRAHAAIAFYVRAIGDRIEALEMHVAPCQTGKPN